MANTKIICTLYVDDVEMRQYTFPRVGVKELPTHPNVYRIVEVKTREHCKIEFRGDIRGLYTKKKSENLEEKFYQHLRETPDPYVIVQHAQVYSNDPVVGIHLCHPDEEDVPLMILQLRAVNRKSD